MNTHVSIYLWIFCGEISISSVVNVLQTSFDSLLPAEKSGHICSVKKLKKK
jgi:hypothetical protein